MRNYGDIYVVVDILTLSILLLSYNFNFTFEMKKPPQMDIVFGGKPVSGRRPEEYLVDLAFE